VSRRGISHRPPKQDALFFSLLLSSVLESHIQHRSNGLPAAGDANLRFQAGGDAFHGCFNDSQAGAQENGFSRRCPIHLATSLQDRFLQFAELAQW
jgi:hypothetical protein